MFQEVYFDIQAQCICICVLVGIFSICISIKWDLMYFLGVESCAIISVSGTRLPLLLCPLGLSDPPFTNDHDDDSFNHFFPGKVSSIDDDDDDENVDIEALCVQRG